MRSNPRTLFRSLASALIAMTMLAGVATAQSDTETIILEVLPFVCQPVGSASINADMFSGPHATIQTGQTQLNQFEDIQFWFHVQNAGCGQWSVTVHVDDFEHATLDDSFSASTLSIRRDESVPPPFNPQRWDDQPAWVDDLPASVSTGDPVMPAHLMETPSGSITISAATGLGSHPLLSASSATHGTPGNSSAYYRMDLTNLPTDLLPGKYAADITVTLQGGD